MKPKLTRRYLLTQVKKLILSEPRRLRMETILKRTQGNNAPPCGTVGCIAGWVCVVAQQFEDSLNLEKAVSKVVRDYRASTSEAAWLLEIGHLEKQRLCYLDDWPEDLKDSYERAKTPLARARVTCKRIDLFLKGRK